MEWLYDFIPTLIYTLVMVLLRLCVKTILTMATVSPFLRQMTECVAYGSTAAGEMEMDDPIYENVWWSVN